jgi:hypothetical protein
MSIPIESLQPVPYNPRTIEPEALKRLAASIREHSLAVDPTPVDPATSSHPYYRLASSVTINRQGNRVVGGNQRVQALLSLGQDAVHEDDITWVDVEPNSDKEKALCLVLNARDAQGDFEWEQVAELLNGLSVERSELEALTGFAPHTFEPLLEADWSPPAADPNADNTRGEKSKALSLTRDQRAVVHKAIARIRDEKEDQSLSEGRCVMLICEGYLA